MTYGAIGAQNLDSDDVGPLSHTVCARSSSAGAVGSVAIAIDGVLARDEVGAGSGTALEFDVGGVDTYLNCQPTILVQC